MPFQVMFKFPPQTSLESCQIHFPFSVSHWPPIIFVTCGYWGSYDSCTLTMMLLGRVLTSVFQCLWMLSTWWGSTASVELFKYNLVVWSQNDELNGSLVPRPAYHKPSKLEAGHCRLWYAKMEQPLLRLFLHQRLEAGRPVNEATQMYWCMKADETVFVEERMARSGG